MNDNLIALASRNAMILRWLRQLTLTHQAHPSIFYNFVAADYAKAMKIPHDEVVLDYITDQESLAWFWECYHESVEAFDKRA